MTGPAETLVVIAAQRVERAREATRAALGLALRGAHVRVVFEPAAAGRRDDAQVARALATLIAFGQAVAEAVGDVPAKVERWTDGAAAAAGPRSAPRAAATATVWLSRGGAPPAGPGDRVILLSELGPDELVEAAFAADRAVVW